MNDDYFFNIKGTRPEEMHDKVSDYFKGEILSQYAASKSMMRIQEKITIRALEILELKQDCDGKNLAKVQHVYKAIELALADHDQRWQFPTNCKSFYYFISCFCVYCVLIMCTKHHIEVYLGSFALMFFPQILLSGNPWRQLQELLKHTMWSLVV